MRNTSLVITVPHLSSSKSALSKESKSYIIAFRFNVLETLQINQFNSQILNNALVQF